MTDILKRGLRNALVTFALIVSAHILLQDFMARDISPEAQRLQSGNTVLFDHRDECWTGEAPADAPKIPGHVIMRIEDGVDGGHWSYLGKHYVNIALIDVFEKDNPRVHVVAFCY